MLKKRFALLALLLPMAMVAQNLVPNPSFETMIAPPCNYLTAQSQMTAAIANWNMPTTGTTDLFSNYVATTCYAHNFSTHVAAPGQQQPHSGNAQATLGMYDVANCGSYREYLQVQLTTPMVIGQTYDVSFWVSMGDACSLAVNKFSMRFSTINTNQPSNCQLPVLPQFTYNTVVTDKIGWVHIAGTVTASAAWRYLIIGNFATNAATTVVNVGGTQPFTRYYIDDVFVGIVVLDQRPEISLDGRRHADGTVSLDWEVPEGLDAEEFALQRSLSDGDWETIKEPTASERAFVDRWAPNTAVKYRLRYVDANGKMSATAAVDVDKIPGLPYSMHLSSNPTHQGDACRLKISNADDAPATVTVRDISGRLIWSPAARPLLEWNDFQFPVDRWQPGIYMVGLQVGGGSLHTKMVIAH